MRLKKIVSEQRVKEAMALLEQGMTVPAVQKHLVAQYGKAMGNGKIYRLQKLAKLPVREAPEAV